MNIGKHGFSILVSREQERERERERTRKPGDVLFPHLICEDGKRRWHITKEKRWMRDTMRIKLSCKTDRGGSLPTGKRGGRQLLEFLFSSRLGSVSKIIM